jgi:hypothetical protein
MSTRTSMFAIAAIATIATTEIAPSSVFAFDHISGAHLGGSQINQRQPRMGGVGDSLPQIGRRPFAPAEPTLPQHPQEKGPV